MSKLQLFRGLPDFDWREAVVDALANGTFPATGNGLTQATLQSGDHVLVISGTGIDITGPRSLNATSITSLVLKIDGVDVALFDSFTLPFTGSLFQSLLDDPPGDVWEELGAVMAAEPINVIGSSEEDWIVGGAFNDTIDGGEDRDYIFTWDGDDIIYAKDTTRAWGDYIQPGRGNNTIIAEKVVASDGYVDGHDLSFSNLWMAVTANLGTGVATAKGMHTTFSHVHWVMGGGGNDSLTGGYSLAHEEGFSGMFGNDTINGLGGRDIVDYGEEVEVGSVNANGIWVTGTKGVKVDLAKGKATDSFGGKDTLINIEVVRGTKFKDTIVGNGKKNELEGNAGADKLDGAGGKDTLDGGLGKDTLIGGNGDDVFRFTTPAGSKNVDKIVGFKSGADSIELDAQVFLGIGNKLTKGEFLVRSSGHAAGDNSDRIIYDKSNGTLWYDRDGAKTKFEAVKFATLDGSPTLKFSDFDMIV